MFYGKAWIKRRSPDYYPTIEYEKVKDLTPVPIDSGAVFIEFHQFSSNILLTLNEFQSSEIQIPQHLRIFKKLSKLHTFVNSNKQKIPSTEAKGIFLFI
jgi:hypothetical protein